MTTTNAIKKVTIELPNGTAITRVPRSKQCGNYFMMFITYKGVEFSITNGDEYLHGYPQVFRLQRAYTKKGLSSMVAYSDDKFVKTYSGLYQTLESIFA